MRGKGAQEGGDFEQSVGELEQAVKIWTRKYRGAKILCGTDLII